MFREFSSRGVSVMCCTLARRIDTWLVERRRTFWKDWQNQSHNHPCSYPTTRWLCPPPCLGQTIFRIWPRNCCDLNFPSRILENTNETTRVQPSCLMHRNVWRGVCHTCQHITWAVCASLSCPAGNRGKILISSRFTVIAFPFPLIG